LKRSIATLKADNVDLKERLDTQEARADAQEVRADAQEARADAQEVRADAQEARADAHEIIIDNLVLRALLDEARSKIIRDTGLKADKIQQNFNADREQAARMVERALKGKGGGVLSLRAIKLVWGDDMVRTRGNLAAHQYNSNAVIRAIHKTSGRSIKAPLEALFESNVCLPRSTPRQKLASTSPHPPVFRGTRGGSPGSDFPFGDA
ncbi:hypothetical protein PAXRUDRAFT_834827, partial [Paxillus rubicundulus Ve08.2h10]